MSSQTLSMCNMKVKAIWRSKNPFHTDIDRLSYSNTVEVPDDTDMEELKKFAIEDSMDGYVFLNFETL